MQDDFYAKPLKNASIEELAETWRLALGIAESTLWVPVVQIVENIIPLILDGYAMVVEKPSRLDTVEAYTEFSPPKIVVRENVYLSALARDGRARWTFAHELGHLMMHDTAVPVSRAPVEYRKMANLPAYASTEKQADKFAAAFLMPKSVACGFNCPVALSAACGVSRQAAAIRLDNLKGR
jgi:Zn-dependent peptidase ImmA (M78 family)